ncbi:MAG TPA: 3-dehydroquinate synthase [Candidatus Kapabacteria bacterium]|jgi:3-dehydroquinate synthase|nr:3-dehydroquinate synthase [Candidatus Kapabacteria bacterium]HOQ49395.1 3-dehydroquinate synthase [Candidatus Kapabacteria bacterium]HPP39732.1 3-dehydroquinate synthase [Candidatus Kapabacteria bacterium]HPU22566.1 3-dehydroquinate synthase [Candidatus Kapabacteria bacterium]
MKRLIEIYFKSQKSTIFFETFEDVAQIYPNTNVILLTDERVHSLYRSKFEQCPTIVVPEGERCKNLETVVSTINKLLEYKADRDTALIGIGGGSVCDLTGFVASVYMRGLRHSFVPTTLLSMVDASIGGKTAINFDEIKNLVGTFKHPEFVVIDTSFLDTLSDKDYSSGIGELIKIAIIADEKFFEVLEKTDLNDRRNINYDIMFESLRKKSEIVIRDEEDRGVRHLLNFGHTFGHVIERQYKLPHGQAVILGMLIAMKISIEMKELSEEVYNRIYSTLTKYLYFKQGMDICKLACGISLDKKRRKNTIDYILLKDIGFPKIVNMRLEDIHQICNKIELELT